MVRPHPLLSSVLHMCELSNMPEEGMAISVFLMDRQGSQELGKSRAELGLKSKSSWAMGDTPGYRAQS